MARDNTSLMLLRNVNLSTSTSISPDHLPNSVVNRISKVQVDTTQIHTKGAPRHHDHQRSRHLHFSRRHGVSPCIPVDHIIPIPRIQLAVSQSLNLQLGRTEQLRDYCHQHISRTGQSSSIGVSTSRPIAHQPSWPTYTPIQNPSSSTLPVDGLSYTAPKALFHVLNLSPQPLESTSSRKVVTPRYDVMRLKLRFMC